MKTKNIEFWNQPRNAKEYLNYIEDISFPINFGSSLLSIFKEQMKEDKSLDGGLLIDLGSGPGNVASLFVKEFGFKTLLAVDSSDYMIYLFPEFFNFPNVRIIPQIEDLHQSKLNINASTADLCIACSILGYLQSVENVFNEVYRTLKPGKFFVFNIIAHREHFIESYIAENPGLDVDFYIHSLFMVRQIWEKFGFVPIKLRMAPEDYDIANIESFLCEIILQKPIQPD
jgi:SAM-dependent methyltransferase